MKGSLPIAVIGLLIVVLAFSVDTVYASTFISSVHDDRLTVTLTYPAEVKRGTCFQVRVEVFAHEPLSHLNVTIKLELRSGATALTLLSSQVVNRWSGLPSTVTNTLVGACVTTSQPTGIIVARVYFEYLHSGDEFNLTNFFQMSFVRDQTYEELATLYGSASSEVGNLRSALNEALRTIGSLTEEIRRLRSEVERQRAEIIALQRERSELENRLNALSALYDRLRRAYEALESNHEKLIREHASLQTVESNLRKSYEELVRAHGALQTEFEKLREELTTLKALHDDLKSRHNTLSLAHEESVRTIGTLRGALEERGRQIEVLNAMLDNALRERMVFSNVVIGQALGLGGLGALYLMERRRTRKASGHQPREPLDHDSPPSPPVRTSGDEENTSASVLRVISGRRITIPKSMAERLGVKVGDLVEVMMVDGHLSVKPFTQPADARLPPEPAEPSRRYSSVQLSRPDQARSRSPA
ncbi:MAG: hypothetical protein NZ988_00620 [Thaumarchaeota archaeon]|nr:hypothetical protein [Candidatus Calditenuaceae archaeon]MDW8186539.1 hypothetical protein [Nitrososphaerota archaeon]